MRFFLPDGCEPVAPNRIKSQERGELNMACAKLCGPYPFKEGVQYLWVLNPDGTVTIGVEKLWQHPSMDVWLGVEGLGDMSPSHVAQARRKGKLGHPTLLSEKTGLQALIGGELNFRNGHWILDNYSGRYGEPSADPHILHAMLKVVVNQFESVAGLTNVSYQVMSRHARYLSNYYSLWRAEKGSVIDKCIRLLEDYVEHSTLHWRRHHVAVVRELIADFAVDKPTTLANFIVRVRNKIKISTLNPTGSLKRRLDFIIDQGSPDNATQVEYQALLNNAPESTADEEDSIEDLILVAALPGC